MDKTTGPKKTRAKSLKELCFGCLGRWIHCLQDVGDIDVEIWLKIVRAARDRATPVIIKRVESNCPHLECKETDTFFWEAAVKNDFPSRKLPKTLVEPYPISKERVLTAVNELTKWQQTEEEKPCLAPIPLEAIIALENALISVKMLRDTRAGHIIKSLIKTQNLDKETTQRLSELQIRWKAYHKLWSLAQPESPSSSSTSPSLSSSSSSSSSKKRKSSASTPLTLPHGLSPCALEAALERCSTWKRLYYFLEEQKQLKFDLFSVELKTKYADAKSNEHRSKKLVNMRPILNGKNKSIKKPYVDPMISRVANRGKRGHGLRVLPSSSNRNK